jgi:hypothetical protein
LDWRDDPSHLDLAKCVRHIGIANHFVKYPEMGRGKQEKTGAARFETRSAKSETRNKHEGSKLEFQNRSFERWSSWRGHHGEPLPLRPALVVLPRRKQEQGQDAPATQGRDALATMATAFRSFAFRASNLFRISGFDIRACLLGERGGRHSVANPTPGAG